VCEVIDEELLRVLSAHSGRSETFLHPPEPMTGGFWAAIYGFELGEHLADLDGPFTGPLVLRVMPNRATAVRETTVQRTVAEQGYPTPRVVLDGFDEGLGGAFMVMQRAEGIPLLAGLGIGRAIVGLPKILRRVARQLAAASAQLHELDTQPVADSLERAGVDIGSLGAQARLEEIRVAAQVPFAGFADLLAWLEQRRPSLEPAVVCHGDIHPFNMLMMPDESFTLLDWTNANLCRRELDVGFTAALLHTAPMKVPKFAQRPMAAITGSLARRFVDTYRRMAPIHLDVVEWFETLQYGRCLAAVAMAPIVDDGIIGADHPFRLSAPAMIRQVQTITDVTITLA
jgi:aminoglycoside phosphotransferase (APT) family kinase protein